MTLIYILVAITVIIQIGFAIAFYRMSKKMSAAIFIRRVGDRLFLEDGDGNVISEKIIIQKTS